MNILAINWGNAYTVVGFGLGMVFTLLVLLVFVLNLFSFAIAPTIKVPVRSKKKSSESIATDKSQDEFTEEHLTANDSAAIAMALHLYYADVHDDESTIITIKTVERRYSPWSSKIYGVNNLVK